MKKLLQSLIVGALLFTGLAVTNPHVEAATIVSSPSGASTNNLLASGAAITQVSIANSSGGAVSIRLLDAPSTDLTYTIGAYTNVTRSVVSVTNSYTDRFGNSQSSVGNMVRTTESVTAASTNDYRSLIILTVPNGETFTYTPTTPVVALQGILLTNQDAVDVTIQYAPIK